jgi:hypothetical protein
MEAPLQPPCNNRHPHQQPLVRILKPPHVSGGAALIAVKNCSLQFGSSRCTARKAGIKTAVNLQYNPAKLTAAIGTKKASAATKT